MKKELTKKLIKRYIAEEEKKKLEQELKDEGIDFKKMECFFKDNLSDLEKEIFRKKNNERKSLKRIAVELNYSYSYTRRVYLSIQNKINNIVNFEKNNNKKEKNYE